MSHSLIAHVEIPTTNPDAEKKFLKDVFGWEFRSFGNGYLLCNTHKGLTVGLRTVNNITVGDNTIFHVLVDDVDATLLNVLNAGGKIERRKTVIPAMGYYALLRDVDGNILGLYQANK